MTTQPTSPSNELLTKDISLRAHFLSNVLYGGKLMSAFNSVRENTPSLNGLSKTTLSDEINTTNNAQTARRAIKLLLLKDKPESVLPTHLIPSATELY